MKPRASRTAFAVASVPDEQKRTFSTDGTAATISSASSVSYSVGVPYDVPRSAARWIASTTAGMRVTGDHRPPRQHVVEVAVPVDVGEVRALGLAHEHRRPADGLERAHRRVHAAGDDALRARRTPLRIRRSVHAITSRSFGVVVRRVDVRERGSSRTGTKRVRRRSITRRSAPSPPSSTGIPSRRNASRR